MLLIHCRHDHCHSFSFSDFLTAPSDEVHASECDTPASCRMKVGSKIHFARSKSDIPHRNEVGLVFWSTLYVSGKRESAPCGFF